jgi:hypothetical protein
MAQQPHSRIRTRRNLLRLMDATRAAQADASGTSASAHEPARNAQRATLYKRRHTFEDPRVVNVQTGESDIFGLRQSDSFTLRPGGIFERAVPS